ncbi:hypothetical protein B296_00055173 [Ensete ventricosum]|uniref:Conserved oligomeric Golgi complex subunit 6 n=1 Tax=Ensete ventricosum TaxID=4639 RepID=A0A426X9Q6_ENSVE|nr:hypothetical protein B296_00055173 [Ensete ventricosum]
MAVTVLAPGLSRKLKKVLETRTDSPDLLSSLATLSTFYADNTPQARRNLRSSIEQRALAINHHFLDASLSAQQLKAHSYLSLSHIHKEHYFLSGDIISTTERLKQELELTTQRQEIVSCFLRDYQLSNDEVLMEAIRCYTLSEVDTY